jgi:hypothetical protein
VKYFAVLIIDTKIHTMTQPYKDMGTDEIRLKSHTAIRVAFSQAVLALNLSGVVAGS